MSHCHKQKGVALITALLVVSIAVILASELVDQLHYDTRRTENMIHNEQAYLYAIQAEQFAINILQEDLNQNDYDSTLDFWAEVARAAEEAEAVGASLMPVEGGDVSGKIRDLQSRFNLNNLSKELNNDYLQAREQFQRLLRIVKIDPGLVDGIIDWLDTDIQVTPTPFGAEDDYYIGLIKPYRTGNRLMVSASELRQVRGFNEEGNFEKLENFIVALPQVTTININTAQAEVIESLSDDITEADAQDIIKQTGINLEDLDGAKPFEDMAEFQKAMNSLGKNNINTNGLNAGTSSDYFLLDGHTRIGRGQVFLYSIIERTKSSSRVIQRSQGAW